MSITPNGASVMAALFGGDGGDPFKEPALPLPEAQIMTLRELAARYRQCVYKPGDLVKMSDGLAGACGTERPCIVLETRPNADVDFSGPSSSHLYGNRRDVRIMMWLEGEYVAFWVESWTLVRWEEPPHDSPPPA